MPLGVCLRVAQAALPERDLRQVSQHVSDRLQVTGFLRLSQQGEQAGLGVGQLVGVLEEGGVTGVDPVGQPSSRPDPFDLDDPLESLVIQAAAGRNRIPAAIPSAVTRMPGSGSLSCSRRLTARFAYATAVSISRVYIVSVTRTSAVAAGSPAASSSAALSSSSTPLWPDSTYICLGEPDLTDRAGRPDRGGIGGGPGRDDGSLCVTGPAERLREPVEPFGALGVIGPVNGQPGELDRDLRRS